MTIRKTAAPMPSASPVPQVSINSTPAPGKRGPVGTSPRSNNSVVHTGTPPPSMVGLDSKVTPPNAAGMLPPRPALPPPQVPSTEKVSEVFMGSIVARPTVNEMLKAAMAGALGRQDIAREAARQAENLGEKTASADTAEETKVASYEQAMQLADAVEFIAGEFSKEAQPGEGPGALKVMESPGGSSLPDHKGQAKSHVVPMSTPLQSAGKGPATQMQNTMDHPAGAGEKQQTSMTGSKHASAIRESFKKIAKEDEKLEKEESKGLEQAEKGLERAEKAHEEEKKGSKLASAIRAKVQTTKVAEDAINPAKISAGAAVPPDTRESGQSGGASPNGASMVASNESATNLTRREAKATPKSDMKAYVDEPALSASTDSVLQAAFSHTGEAGAKIASIRQSTKTAAARQLLSKLASAAEEKKVAKG